MYGSIGGGVYASISRFQPNLRFYPTYANNLYISTDCYYINKKHIKNIDEKVYGDNNVKYYNITMANDFNIDVTTEYENLIFDIRSFKLKKLLGE